MKNTEELKKIRAMKPEELTAELSDAQKKLFTEQLRVSAGKTQNYAVIREIKKSVARIQTVMNEKGAINE